MQGLAHWRLCRSRAELSLNLLHKLLGRELVKALEVVRVGLATGAWDALQCLAEIGYVALQRTSEDAASVSTGSTEPALGHVLTAACVEVLHPRLPVRLHSGPQLGWELSGVGFKDNVPDLMHRCTHDLRTLSQEDNVLARPSGQGAIRPRCCVTALDVQGCVRQVLLAHLLNESLHPLEHGVVGHILTEVNPGRQGANLVSSAGHTVLGHVVL